MGDHRGAPNHDGGLVRTLWLPMSRDTLYIVATTTCTNPNLQLHPPFLLSLPGDPKPPQTQQLKLHSQRWALGKSTPASRMWPLQITRFPCLSGCERFWMSPLSLTLSERLRSVLVFYSHRSSCLNNSCAVSQLCGWKSRVSVAQLRTSQPKSEGHGATAL